MDVKPVITRPIAKISMIARMISGLPPMTHNPVSDEGKYQVNQRAILDIKNQTKD
ncbi:hypothetical protein [Marinobacter subterrani]|uniref:hypothetical protein n=1 Tax=Marinobacter subterrani TaxID=1658765 RepID=UPI0018CF22A9|nr:hypothetical protein [Marinobacter subterrani]